MRVDVKTRRFIVLPIFHSQKKNNQIFKLSYFHGYFSLKIKKNQSDASHLKRSWHSIRQKGNIDERERKNEKQKK